MKPLSGPALARQLSPHFPVGKATRKRSGEFAGCHVIDFFHPGWDKPVLPAEQLASELVSHLGGNIRIVKTYQQEKHYVDDPFVMCSTVVLRMDAVPTIPIPRLLMLPAPRIAGLLTAGQVAVTRYQVGDVVRIPGTQRTSRVLEVGHGQDATVLQSGVNEWVSTQVVLRTGAKGCKPASYRVSGYPGEGSVTMWHWIKACLKQRCVREENFIVPLWARWFYTFKAIICLHLPERNWEYGEVVHVAYTNGGVSYVPGEPTIYWYEAVIVGHGVFRNWFADVYSDSN